MAQPYFTRAAFDFLKDLRENNSREWFKANKSRYEESVKHPAMRFITDFGPELKKISPHFQADPRPVGGSMFRIHRDVRFSKDKSPYKTAVGIQFRHDRGKDAHAPGFYLHIEPGSCFLGAGCWRPDSASLKAIRQAIVDDPEGWKKASGGRRFTEVFELGGDSLKRGPRDFDHDHPLIEDIKRKDFVAVAEIPETFVTDKGLPRRLRDSYSRGAPLVEFLCEAVGVRF